MKKRFLALLLTLVMALALTVPALAVELKTGDNGYGTGEFELNVTADSVGAVTTYKYQPDADSDFVAEVPVYDIKAYEVVKFTGTAGWMFLLSSTHVTAADGVLTQISDWVYSSSEGAEGEYIWYMFDSEDAEGMMTLIAVQPEALAGIKYVGLRLNNQAAVPAEPEKPVEPAKPTEPAPPAAGTYTAKKYDTWGQLALNNYGTYGVWKQLMKANGNKAVKADMVITLPEKLGSYNRLPAQVLAEGEQFYTVKAGDTLGQIAVATYKDFNMYKAIFERNSDRLKNANMIYEGQILILPAKK